MHSDGPRVSRRVVIGGLSGLALAGCLGDDEEERLDHRGEIEIRIDGEPVDLSKDRYQAEHADEYAMAFHLHEGSDQWYNEGQEPVTIAEGLDKLPEWSFTVEEQGYVLSIDDETWDSREDGVNIETAVNEEAVAPEDYELEDGDAILVEVETHTAD